MLLFESRPIGELGLSRSGHVGNIIEITAVKRHNVEAGRTVKKEFSGGENEIIFDCADSHIQLTN